MWCWDRIRKQESGLCPACRTPYGEDPHQFSAVDVEEALRLSKQQQQQQSQPIKRDSVPQSVASSLSSSSHDDDRSSLANMRVIRRNLVYAVGLPPLPEDAYRSPPYFGQYGKISKLVVNRSGGLNNRASAYVTFVHAADALACIRALDSFALQNAIVRASYGTSKYCAAFCRHQKCNNPECTYLHERGAPEDSFTKQEIQAGYVTSGRDITENAKSESGRPAANPIFPPPEYESKRSTSMVARPPPPSALSTRAVSASSGLMRKSVASVVAAGRPEPEAQNPLTTLTPLGGKKLTRATTAPTATTSALSALGGEVFNGPLLSANSTPTNTVGRGADENVGGAPLAGLYNNSNNRDESSALASILGVALPSGSGSLRENNWNTQPPQGPSALSELNGTPLSGTPSLIGGVPIHSVTLGLPPVSNGGGKSDLALLQSLLPGVQIAANGSSQRQQWNGPGALDGETLAGWGGGGTSTGAIGRQQNGGAANGNKQGRQRNGIW